MTLPVLRRDSRHTARQPLVIALVPFDALATDLGPISAAVAAAFTARVVVADSLSLPERAFDRSRHQWAAEPFVLAVSRARRPEWSRALGITSVDLFAPQLNFVFGQASPSLHAAIMSTARLEGSEKLQATEAVHELGHTFALGHCDDPRCVMWFSNTVEESKRKGAGFCERHREQLRRTGVGVA